MPGTNSVRPCHTCRRKRLVCDGKHPTCQKCLSRSVECLGYGEHPLLWVQPESCMASLNQNNSESNAQTATIALNQHWHDTKVISQRKKKLGRPRLVLMEQPNRLEPGQRVLDDRTVTCFEPIISQREELSPKFGQMAPSLQFLLPEGYSEAQTVLDRLLYFNGVICPDVVVFDSPDNPHRIAPKIWHLIPSSMLEFLFAIVGTHRLIRSRSSYMFAQGSVKVGRIAKTSSDITCCHLDSFAHPLLNTIYRHQRQALQGLMELINEEDSRFSDSTLGLIAAFMLSNVQQSAYSNWWIHLEAIRTILAQRGGLKSVVNTSQTLDYALDVFMLVDIMRCVTTTSSALGDRVASQLTYVEHFSKVHKDGKTVGFPCPNQLLEAIIHINHLRSSVHDTLNCHASQKHSQVEGFLKQILSVSLSNSTKSCRNSLVTFKDCHARVYSSADDWENVVSAFQASVVLYGIRTLILDADSTRTESGSSLMDFCLLHSTTAITLLEQLHHLFSPESRTRNPWVGKFMFWPFFVAGMECFSSPFKSYDPNTVSVERDFIIMSLCEIASVLGDLSAFDAALFLKDIWAVQLDRSMLDPKGSGIIHAQMTWDERVSFLGNHSLFAL